MDVLRHPHFIAVLAWIGAVLMVVGFAATEPEDRASFKALGSIVLVTVLILKFASDRS